MVTSAEILRVSGTWFLLGCTILGFYLGLFYLVGLVDAFWFTVPFDFAFTLWWLSGLAVYLASIAVLEAVWVLLIEGGRRVKQLVMATLHPPERSEDIRKPPNSTLHPTAGAGVGVE